MESVRTSHDTGLCPPRSIFSFEVDFFAVYLAIFKVVLFTKLRTPNFWITTVLELQVSKCVVIVRVPTHSVRQRLALPIVVQKI